MGWWEGLYVMEKCNRATNKEMIYVEELQSGKKQKKKIDMKKPKPKKHASEKGCCTVYTG